MMEDYKMLNRHRKLMLILPETEEERLIRLKDEDTLTVIFYKRLMII